VPINLETAYAARDGNGRLLLGLKNSVKECDLVHTTGWRTQSVLPHLEMKRTRLWHYLNLLLTSLGWKGLPARFRINT